MWLGLSLCQRSSCHGCAHRELYRPASHWLGPLLRCCLSWTAKRHGITVKEVNSMSQLCGLRVGQPCCPHHLAADWTSKATFSTRLGRWQGILDPGTPVSQFSWWAAGRVGKGWVWSLLVSGKAACPKSQVRGLPTSLSSRTSLDLTWLQTRLSLFHPVR